MAIKKYSKSEQAYGEFNGGGIIENKPIGFPQGGGGGSHPYSNIFYWAKAVAIEDSTIGEHPHQAFEILSFVLDGKIEHYDSHNQKWFPLEKGDVQVIKSGNGIYHSEKMYKDSVMFQIWFNPDINVTLKQQATYSDHKAEDFDIIEEGNIEKKKMLGNGSPIQLVSEDVTVEQWKVPSESKTNIDSNKYHSVYILSGSGEINGENVTADDYLVISDENELVIDSNEELELFYISSPKELSHDTYYQSHKNRYQ
jgi:redox-sensitive bicupin YhaK (pirin superfamily)